jgi:hypothetical protein
MRQLATGWLLELCDTLLTYGGSLRKRLVTYC